MAYRYEDAASRGVVSCRGGALATSQPLATSAGLRILQDGGSCFDAAVAVSAVLAVVEPGKSHLGGDAFVVAYDAMTGRLVALNGSGAAPLSMPADAFGEEIPRLGARSATVPGLPGVWRELMALPVRMPVARLLAPAIHYAASGFPATDRYCLALSRAAGDRPREQFLPLAQVLAGADGVPTRGHIVRQPALAATLETLADHGLASFYAGGLAEAIADEWQSLGGWATAEDLAAHSTQVSAPISVPYRGYLVHGQPPVSQGMILLESLGIVEGFDLNDMGWGSPHAIHTMVEAIRLAFADRHRYLGDPGVTEVPVDALLSPGYLRERRQAIDPGRAAATVDAGTAHSDTTYFCIVDGDGNAVSFIQSVFHSFGCGVVLPSTGILLNNRMTGFSLDPGSPNCIAAGKRPAHTLNAYVVTRDGKPALVGGTPGGNIQVQSNLQVICNAIDHGLDPQRAIDAPRWQYGGQLVDGEHALLEIEEPLGSSVGGDLGAMGHRVRAIPSRSHGSSYQLIRVNQDSGVLECGSDGRCEGHAAGF